MSDQQVNFQPLRDEGLSEIDEKMLSIFEPALESVSEATLEEKAGGVAIELKKLVPMNLSSEGAETFLEGFWELLIGIAKCVPYRHSGQILLVKIATNLNESGEAIEKKGSSWKGLPFLGRYLRDNWIDPTLEAGDDETEHYSLEEWLNLNSFSARLLGAGLAGWVNFAVWQLRHGLEEEMSPGPSTDSRVAAAGEWIIQSGQDLLRRCLLNSALNEAEARSYSAGALYAGNPGLCLERWGFWKRRLGEMRGKVGESAMRSIDEAVESMTAAEMAIAKQRKDTAEGP
ncbi:MAG: hypothetical protein M1840_000457 [Geoglossum simile]|nr:MAG: hypothetical protein M1840_000457 [Geoglossum simile]